MTFVKSFKRSSYMIGGGFLALLLLVFLFAQAQQWILRWRAERLMADMQQIQLYQSTWTDAQRLMHHWGAWGHYEGSCTAASCKYVISLDSILGFYNDRASNPKSNLNWLLRILMHDKYGLYYRLGGRQEAFIASFVVHNGTIWRKDFSVELSYPANKMQRGVVALVLIVSSRSQLNRMPGEQEVFGVFIGSDNQLSLHPYYKIGWPSACSSCEIKNVTYSTYAPKEEVKKLTTFDFSCFTRFKPCTEFEQFYPVAKEWVQNKDLRDPCGIPIWALARDANYILVVEVLKEGKEKVTEITDETIEKEEVKVIDSIKKSSPWTPGAVVSLYPRAPVPSLTPGKQYIVFPDEDWDGVHIPKNSPIYLSTCGVEDTPEARRELEKGFAQNDTLNP